MVHVPPSSTAPFIPQPKYGHLSRVNPSFAPLASSVESDFSKLWALDLSDFKAVWLAAPLALFPDSPAVGKDINVEHFKVPVRDEALVELRVYRPVQKADSAVLFFMMHASGWTVGSHDTDEAINRHVAAETGAVVVSVDYRLAPEFKFPYALNDSFDALQWCKANSAVLGIDPETIILAGTSSGGNLAAALGLLCVQTNTTGILAQVLNIPPLCHPSHFPTSQYEYGSFEQNRDAPALSAPRMQWYWDQYLPDPSVGKEPLASPLLAQKEDLQKLGPVLLQIAGLDPVRDEAFAYADALTAAGVPTTVKVFPGLPHGFHFFPQLKESREFVQNIVDFVREIVSKGSHGK